MTLDGNLGTAGFHIEPDSALMQAAAEVDLFDLLDAGLTESDLLEILGVTPEAATPQPEFPSWDAFIAARKSGKPQAAAHPVADAVDEVFIDVSTCGEVQGIVADLEAALELPETRDGNGEAGPMPTDAPAPRATTATPADIPNQRELRRRRDPIRPDEVISYGRKAAEISHGGKTFHVKRLGGSIYEAEGGQRYDLHNCAARS
jgi:hypothetical protein